MTSSTFRMPSFTAATIKSWSISLSPPEKTSGSIWIESSCFCPFIFTETMPPPAVASTTVASICFCNCSCICCACLINCCGFIKLLPFRGLDLGQISSEHFQEPLYERFFLDRFHGDSISLLLFLDYKRH